MLMQELHPGLRSSSRSPWPFRALGSMGKFKEFNARLLKWANGLKWWQITLLLTGFYGTFNFLWHSVFDWDFNLRQVCESYGIALFISLIFGPLIAFVRRDKEKWERDEQRKREQAEGKDQ